MTDPACDVNYVNYVSQVTRADDTCECIGLRGLYPAGEGAGYAGGIVSAAVDGTRVAESMLAHALSNSI